jgi:hypothetical protein
MSTIFLSITHDPIELKMTVAKRSNPVSLQEISSIAPTQTEYHTMMASQLPCILTTADR